VNGAVLLLAFITLQRFAEFLWDRRNTEQLLAAGAIEVGQAHYPLVLLVPAAWLAGLWTVGHQRAVVAPFLLVFLLLQVARYWVLATLGRHWTTRILVLPGGPPITAGPYKFVRHPNYLVMAGEVAVVPLALDLPLYALLFLIAFAGMPAVRIPVENAALADISAQGARTGDRSILGAEGTGARRSPTPPSTIGSAEPNRGSTC
jgi:methyltransferase